MTNNTSLISCIGIEKNDVSLSYHNTLKFVTTIRPGKKEKVDISRDFHTTPINRCNLKDGIETIGVNTKMCYPKMTDKVLLYSSVPLKSLNIFKKFMEEAIAGVFPLKWDRTSDYLIPKIIKKKMRRTWLGKKMMVMKALESFLKYKI